MRACAPQQYNCCLSIHSESASSVSSTDLRSFYKYIHCPNYNPATTYFHQFYLRLHCNPQTRKRSLLSSESLYITEEVVNEDQSTATSLLKTVEDDDDDIVMESQTHASCTSRVNYDSMFTCRFAFMPLHRSVSMLSKFYSFLMSLIQTLMLTRVAR